MHKLDFKNKTCQNNNNCKYFMYSYCQLYHCKKQQLIKCPLGISCYRIKFGTKSRFKCPFIHDQSDYKNMVDQIYPKVQCNKLTKDKCDTDNCKYYHSDDNYDIQSICLNFSSCSKLLIFGNTCKYYHLPGDSTITIYLHILKYSIDNESVYNMNLICELMQLDWKEICKYIKCLDCNIIPSNNQLYKLIVDNIYLVSMILGKFIDSNRFKCRDFVIIENYNKIKKSNCKMLVLSNKICDCCNDVQDTIITHTDCKYNTCIYCFNEQLNQSKINGSIDEDGIKCVFCKSYKYDCIDLKNIVNHSKCCEIQSISHTINEIESITNESTIVIPNNTNIIDMLIKLIELSIITSHCPICYRTFYDNDACRLVTCTCGVEFCAYCQKINANHLHVANCQLRPINTNDTFSSEIAFNITRYAITGIRINSVIDEFWKIYGSKIECIHTLELFNKLNKIYDDVDYQVIVKLKLPWQTSNF